MYVRVAVTATEGSDSTTVVVPARSKLIAYVSSVNSTYADAALGARLETRFAKFTSTSTAPRLVATFTKRTRAAPVAPGRLSSVSTTAVCEPGDPVTTTDVSVAGANGGCALAMTAPGAVTVWKVTLWVPAASVS